MPGKALRTALVQSVVWACFWSARRLTFSSQGPPKCWQKRQFVVFAGVFGAIGRSAVVSGFSVVSAMEVPPLVMR